MNSIRRRLLVWQIGALLVTGLVVSVITYFLAWDGFNRVRDYNLEQIAYSILRHGVVSADGEEEGDAEDRGRFISQIWNAKGGLDYASDPGIALAPQPDGLHIVHLDASEWHVFTLRSGGLTIQVAHATTERRAMFAGIAPWLLIPLTVLVAMLGLLIRAAVGRAVAPLNQVRDEIVRRDIASLHALDLRQLPDEIVPLVEALNALLARLDREIASQRRFVADAAHALRTPLTAIRLQNQLAERTQQTAEGQAALARLGEGIERAAHLVEQLLGMARLEAGLRDPVRTPVRLDELAKQVVSEFSTLAEARSIDLGITECQAVTLSGQADGLKLMLGNLVDNAIRYTPAGGRVDVAVGQDGGAAVLSVSDTGPGIPEAARGRAFDRFFRLAGADTPGSGLGLAIVREVAEAHGGEAHLEAAPGGGLRASVRLPFFLG